MTSEPDSEGKTIGINIFYESLYHTPGYNVTSPMFMQRRYYQHLKTTSSGGLGLLKPCDSEFICFHDGADAHNHARLADLVRELGLPSDSNDARGSVEQEGGRQKTKRKKKKSKKRKKNTGSRGAFGGAGDLKMKPRATDEL